MLRSIAVASLLSCALPALAQTAPPASRSSNHTVAQSTPAANKNPEMSLPTTNGKPLPPSSELALPDFENFNVAAIKDIHLCIFPFFREDKAGHTNGQTLDKVQKIFSDVAHSTPLGKDTQVIGKETTICGIEDTACLAGLGAFTNCNTVVTGRVTREDNGFTLRARIIDTKGSGVLASVNQVVATDDENEMAAWAEGQACRALKAKCEGTLKIDADRPDMRIVIDNRTIDRRPSLAPGVPEILPLQPGVYKLRATIGDRTSREVILALRRNQSDTVFVRQTSDGGIPLMLKSELRPSEIPGPSVDVRGTKPTKIVGIVSAGLGVVALAVAGQQALHSKSLANDAQSDLTTNGGYYQPGQLNTATGVASAKNNATIFTAVGAGLVVLGAVLFFAF